MQLICKIEYKALSVLNFLRNTSQIDSRKIRRRHKEQDAYLFNNHVQFGEGFYIAINLIIVYKTLNAR